MDSNVWTKYHDSPDISVWKEGVEWVIAIPSYTPLRGWRKVTDTVSCILKEHRAFWDDHPGCFFFLCSNREDQAVRELTVNTRRILTTHTETSNNICEWMNHGSDRCLTDGAGSASQYHWWHIVEGMSVIAAQACDYSEPPFSHR